MYAIACSTENSGNTNVYKDVRSRNAQNGQRCTEFQLCTACTPSVTNGVDQEARSGSSDGSGHEEQERTTGPCSTTLYDRSMLHGVRPVLCLLYRCTTGVRPVCLLVMNGLLLHAAGTVAFDHLHMDLGRSMLRCSLYSHCTALVVVATGRLSSSVGLVIVIGCSSGTPRTGAPGQRYTTASVPRSRGTSTVVPLQPSRSTSRRGLSYRSLLYRGVTEVQVHG